MKLLSSFFLLLIIIGNVTYYRNLSTNLYKNHDAGIPQKIVDRYGKLIRIYQQEGALSLLNIEKVPSLLTELVVKAEDKRFFKHNGIDFWASFRALKQNIMGLRKVSGASTITQQVVRLAFGYKRTFLNKIFVMIHALKVENSLTKGEILEFYLASIPYTYKVKGIIQGASYYFGKELEKLSPAEMATLVVLIRAPSKYSSPLKQKKMLDLRNKLLENSSLDHNYKSLSQKEKWYFKKYRPHASSPHFVRSLLEYEPRESMIYSTLDLKLQKEVQDIVNHRMESLKKKGVGAAAVIVIDNNDGGILSYIGNYDFFSSQGGEYDGVKLRRQPGSTMKPFTYALALESGFTAGSSLKDEKMYFTAGNGTFKPRNYSNTYTGFRTLRESLANSLNIPSLYLADHVGVENLYRYINSFGINFDRPSDYYGVGLTLGNAELRLIDLVSAYTAFPNKGSRVVPRYLLNQRVRRKKTKMRESTAELITDILSDHNARREAFGMQSALDTLVPSAGKTGTSTLYRDNWVIGYTTHYTVGVWVGNMDQKEMQNVSGISGAGPIYQAVINATAHYYHSEAFRNVTEFDKNQICARSGHKKTRYCNRTYTEKFIKGTSPKIQCQLHQKKSNNLNPQFKILSPVSGAIFAMDKSIPSHLQKVNIQTNAKNIKSMKWFVNDKLVSSIKDEYFWTMKKGIYKIKVELVQNNDEHFSDHIFINIL